MAPPVLVRTSTRDEKYTTTNPSWTFDTTSCEYVQFDFPIGYHETGPPTAVTVDGVALTKIGEITSPTTVRYLQRWAGYIPVGNRGIGKTVAVTGQGNGFIALVTMRGYSNVHPTTPVRGSVVTGSGTFSEAGGTGLQTISVPSAIDDLVTDAYLTDPNGGVTSWTVGAGQTEDVNGVPTYATSSLNWRSTASHEAGATGSVVMNWTLAGGGTASGVWAAIGTSIQPPDSGAAHDPFITVQFKAA